jgi:hypothetical protein
MASLKEYSPLVPFDLYDFFGYLFPGVFFGVSTLAFIGHSMPQVLEYHQALWIAYDKAPILISMALSVGAIIVLYVIGHVIATVSHVIIDRVLVDGVVGYPVSHLLRLPRRTREYVESTYKYLFGLFNAVLLMPVLFNSNELVQRLITILLVLIGLIIVLRFVVMIVRADPWRRRTVVPRIAAKKWVRVYLWPAKYVIDPVIGFSQRLLGIDKRFPGQFIREYKGLFRREFKMEPAQVGSENYWLPFFYVSTKRPSSTGMINTWLHLYGFSRNSAAAGYMSAALITVCVYAYPDIRNEAARIQLALLLCVAAVLGLRYWLLYSTYYTKNIIRSFVECALSDSGDKVTTSASR